jgi:hypothetical protein
MKYKKGVKFSYTNKKRLKIPKEAEDERKKMYSVIVL